MPSQTSVWFILPPNRSRTKSSGLVWALRLSLSATNQSPRSIAGTDAQHIVAAMSPYLYASVEYITNASAENEFMYIETPASHHGVDLSEPKYWPLDFWRRE